MLAIQAQLELLNTLADLSDEEKMDMLFHLVDKDHTGTVDAKELASGMRKRNTDLTIFESLDRAMSMVAFFDQDGDAQLDRDEFENCITTMVAELVGVTFHEFSEFLILQLAFADLMARPEEMLFESIPYEMADSQEMEKEIKTREAELDPRMMALFMLFDKDGDGSINFPEVAIGLYQLTQDMEVASQAALEMLLMMENNDERVLDYSKFSRLMFAVAASAGKTVDEISDDLTLSLLSQPVVMTSSDLDVLIVADECYELVKDVSDLMTEEVMVMDALEYAKTQKVFDMWDQDKNGFIDFQELLQGMRKFQGAMEMDESVERAAFLMLGFDENSDQKLDKPEFARAIVSFAKAMEVDLHDLIDFMCLVSAMKENSEYEKEYAKLILQVASAEIQQMQQLVMELDE
jgi:Ca2+-binding EF-hand superfamily protein